MDGPENTPSYPEKAELRNARWQLHWLSELEYARENPSRARNGMLATGRPLVLSLVRESTVDLNRLYFDHQILLIRAFRAADPASGKSLFDRASDLARDISRIHLASGATAVAQWNVLATAKGAFSRPEPA